MTIVICRVSVSQWNSNFSILYVYNLGRQLNGSLDCFSQVNIAKCAFVLHTFEWVAPDDRDFVVDAKTTQNKNPIVMSSLFSVCSLLFCWRFSIPATDKCRCVTIVFDLTPSSGFELASAAFFRFSFLPHSHNILLLLFLTYFRWVWHHAIANCTVQMHIAYV